ncbi:amphi-Trp domain-containing protein [Halobacteria archaeon AArc-curdl1]|uniref:Amphi-Trp domain-containing protein n=1 Tax=Natronosalvus hydrolyticus TaxID=2979988 RepID=A0AAP2Z8V6_9EURY|nr:amphi-Trp domain-containing protein [Halobacteria archaeon AArc-curdl1]
MPEEILFKFEQQMSTDEIADYLRSVADRIESGEPLSLESGTESVTMDVPANPTFEIKAERETSSSGGTPELSVEFELEWDEGADNEAGGDSSLTIS